MKYTISYQNPHQHFIDITCVIENVNSEIIDVHLPAWRPGRYELGNFAKNIQKWNVEDEKGNSLKSYKISKDHWRIKPTPTLPKGGSNNAQALDAGNSFPLNGELGGATVIIHYNYYAAELNAGSTFLDEGQLYINPVNCLLYVKERMNEEHILELKIPEDYKVATGLKKAAADSSSGQSAIGSRQSTAPGMQRTAPGNSKDRKFSVFTANSYDELADSPLIASNTLRRNYFVYEGVEFNLWFQGECEPDWGKIIGDFFIFVNEQYELFKDFPVKEYHFLFQILPNKFHHGVEHLNSTVIALGPGYNLMSGALYDEFLGVSSHELFHSWNIKSIRPVEMSPYDFSKENYSRLGYVAEGVTTYYGDLILFRSGIFSDIDFAKKLSENVQKHFDNFGRTFRSVADSSFDTWLDGYGKSIPNRVMSIYADGCILAFMTDIFIRKSSENKFSLDDVMRMLYYEFSKKEKGYLEADYKKLIESAAGKNFDSFFENFIWGTFSFENQLKECIDYLGCELVSNKSNKFYEAHWGIKTSPTPYPSPLGRGEIISSIYPGSVADEGGLGVNDEIIFINGFEIKNDLAEWSCYFAFKQVILLVKRANQVFEIKLKPSKEIFYRIYFIKKLENPTVKQKENFEKWGRRKF